MNAIELRKEILISSFENHWAHLPSAFSHVDYIYKICETLEPENTKIIFGKPFGAQGYYIPFKHFGFIDDYNGFSEGVKIEELQKHSKFPEIFTFSEETIGNALGVAIGVALANRTKVVWCNISDASLQMGQTLEALLFIFEHSKELKNLNVTIDYNNRQVHSELNPDISPIITMLYHSLSINAHFLHGHEFSPENENREIHLKITDKPTFYVFDTIKGKGNHFFERRPENLHYSTLNSETELKHFIGELYEF